LPCHGRGRRQGKNKPPASRAGPNAATSRDDSRRLDPPRVPFLARGRVSSGVPPSRSLRSVIAPSSRPVRYVQTHAREWMMGHRPHLGRQQPWGAGGRQRRRHQFHADPGGPARRHPRRRRHRRPARQPGAGRADVMPAPVPRPAPAHPPEAPIRQCRDRAGTRQEFISAFANGPFV